MEYYRVKYSNTVAKQVIAVVYKVTPLRDSEKQKCTDAQINTAIK